MLLDVKNLQVFYGSVLALDDVSFEVGGGEIVAMIGPNGAGKSTSLKAVVGLLDAYDGYISKGEILFQDKAITGLRTDELVKLGISLVPEGRRVFPSMTVRENLEMGAFTKDNEYSLNDNIARVLDIFPQLKDRVSQNAGTLSGGEQQMLALGRALMIQPKLLLADEPSLGLSPNYVEIIFEKLTDINKTGTSILLVEQNAQMALEVCHRAYVFETGKIVLHGERENLINDDRVKDVFLGGQL